MPTSTSSLPIPTTVPGLSEDAARLLITRARRHLPPVKRRGRPRHWDNDEVLWLSIYHLWSGLDISDIATREGVSVRSAQEWIARGVEAISRVRGVLPDGEMLTSPDQVLEWIEDHGGEAIVDGTEMAVERPMGSKSADGGYSDVQKPYYSGKAKRHTMKSQVLSDHDRNLLAVTDPVPGAIHDMALLVETGWVGWLNGVTLGGDRGYQGLEEIHPDARIPYKKPRGGEFNVAQRDYNTRLASWRVVVEHAIGRFKLWKVLRRVKLRRSRLRAVFRAIFVLTTYRQAWP